MKNKFLHNKERGCEVEHRKVYVRIDRGLPVYVDGAYCVTHDENLCRCGWQKGFHYGTNSLLIGR